MEERKIEGGGNELLDGGQRGEERNETNNMDVHQQCSNSKNIRRKQLIPDYILNNVELNKAVSKLPSNYNFEIHKSIYMIKKNSAKVVALQFPEGLLVYSCLISDILRHFASVQVIILGDPTYGACCIDDYTAIDLGADYLIHYGHSCLIPITSTNIKTLYIFVTININNDHFLETIKTNIIPSKKIAFMSTIQYIKNLQHIQNKLKEFFPNISIPQEKPLSPGELLGCTSPILTSFDALLFIGDGRFHIESALIQNPHLEVYLYNPFNKKLTLERYDFERLATTRSQILSDISSCNIFGIVLGSLGRQGNPSIVIKIQKYLESKNKKVITVILSEITSDKLSQIDQVDVWVEVACPRLAIDWGVHYNKPVITPFELYRGFGEAEYTNRYNNNIVHPMDWYSNEGGMWSNYYQTNKR